MRPRGINPLYDPDNPTGEVADPREGGRFLEEHLRECATSVAAGLTSIPETQMEKVPDDDLPTRFNRHDDPKKSGPTMKTRQQVKASRMASV